MLPVPGNYSQYASGNYGAHTLSLTYPNGITLYYSYQTVVAFHTPETGLVVSENIWGSTTGKHLNWLDGGRKSQRLRRLAYIEKLVQAMCRYGLAIPKEEI